MIKVVSKAEKLDFIQEARRLLALFGDIEWSGTEEQTDEEHLKDYANTLAKTRHDHPEMAEKTALHWISGPQDMALALIGHTAAAADRAKAIVGFIRNMPLLLDAFEVRAEDDEEFARRIAELLQHNSDQLLENRALRETIRKQQAQIDWLMEQIPGAKQSKTIVTHHSGDDANDEGWYIVSFDPDGTTYDSVGPYDSEGEAMRVLAA